VIIIESYLMNIPHYDPDIFHEIDNRLALNRDNELFAHAVSMPNHQCPDEPIAAIGRLMNSAETNYNNIIGLARRTTINPSSQSTAMLSVLREILSAIEAILYNCDDTDGLPQETKEAYQEKVAEIKEKVNEANAAFQASSQENFSDRLLEISVLLREAGALIAPFVNTQRIFDQVQ
jgi:hypothetical protein